MASSENNYEKLLYSLSFSSPLKYIDKFEWNGVTLKYIGQLKCNTDTSVSFASRFLIDIKLNRNMLIKNEPKFDFIKELNVPKCPFLLLINQFLPSGPNNVETFVHLRQFSIPSNMNPSWKVYEVRSYHKSKFKTQGATYTFHKFNTMHKILTLFKTKSKLKLNQCYFLCLGFLLGYAKSWWWSQGGAAQVGSVRVVVVWNAILMFRYYFFEITHWSDEDTWETPFNVWHYAFRFLSCLTIFPLFFTSKSTNH